MKSSQGIRILLLALALTGMGSTAFAGDSDSNSDSDSDGLNRQARSELRDAGVDRYLGQFAPVASTDVGDGWVKHTFDPGIGDGPICILGTPYSVFTRDSGADSDSDSSDSDSDSDSDRGRKAKELLIFMQGGGACWQGFYNCTPLVEDGQQEPPPAFPAGIYDFDSKDNPFRKYAIVYMPYCDGSVFSGDNDVFPDPGWQAFVEGLLGLPPGTGPLVRFHRGLRNQSAGMDLAKAMYPKAKRITVAGSSAGGAGAAAFAPFLARFLFGNKAELTIFNDAGPVVVNLASAMDVADRANDWQFEQFFPASCAGCGVGQQLTALIDWRLDNDSTIREAFYETDADLTNRFFLDFLFDPVGFRNLVVTEQGFLNADHPRRYKRFIVAGDDSHTALQTPLFYLQDANGVLLNEWTADFLRDKKGWVDIVEDPVP